MKGLPWHEMSKNRLSLLVFHLSLCISPAWLISMKKSAGFHRRSTAFLGHHGEESD